MTDEPFDPEATPLPELGDLAPEPPSDYWSTIDAKLAAIEADQPALGREHPSDGEEGWGVPGDNFDASGDTTDTDADIIRLDDMKNIRNGYYKEWRPEGSSILAIAAAALLLIIGGTFAAVSLTGADGASVNVEAADSDNASSSRSTETAEGDEASTDETIDRTSNETSDGETTTDSSASDDENDSTTQDSSGVSLPATTTCWAGERHVVMLDINNVGEARAAEALNGEPAISTAVGHRQDGTEATFIMAVTNASGTSTQIWDFGDDALYQGEGDEGSVEIDCSQIPRAQELLDAMPNAGSPNADTIKPVLAAGSTTCWAKSVDSPMDDLFEIKVDADATSVSLSSFGTTDPTIDVIRTGVGSFVSGNELAISVETWTVDGRTTQTDVFVIDDDGALAIRPYLEWTATPVGCGEVDRHVRSGGEGFDTFAAGEIRFETGSSSGSAESAVVLGQRNLHTFEATADQAASISITSLEDNAVFDLVTPEGQAIVVGAESTSLRLPSSGDYTILVGGTRGNASYTLTLTITG